MSIEINRIKDNPSPYSSPTSGEGRKVVFKSNPILQDKVEISPKKKELSTTSKFGIGLGVLTLIGVGIYKRKSLKKLWEKIINRGVENSETVKNLTGSLKNVDEAKEYFESIGIKTILKKGSENHLTDLNDIKKDLALLERNGVLMLKPASIVVADWHNGTELKQILKSINVAESEADICAGNTWAWGMAVKGSDDKCHVLINSSFNGNYGRFIHEMGHIHQDYLNSSYWGSKGLKDAEFIKKQMNILGLSEVNLLHDFSTPEGYLSSILRYYHLPKNMPNETKEKICRMFPNIGENDFEKIFAIPDISGKTYYVNAKKMVDKMASESGVYAPTKTWENVAEIFQGLNKGKEYSDLVMLIYDINGGGRVPNLVIKGMKYDDYIESLYNNKDLIRQLRESIELKQIT